MQSTIFLIIACCTVVGCSDGGAGSVPGGTLPRTGVGGAASTSFAGAPHAGAAPAGVGKAQSGGAGLGGGSSGSAANPGGAGASAGGTTGGANQGGTGGAGAPPTGGAAGGGGTVTNLTVGCANNPMPSGPTGTWNLTFCDEFSGTAVDQNKWSVNWGNGKGDSWTKVSWSQEIMSTENLQFPGDGALHVVAEQRNGTWYSGAVQTSATFTQTYGAYEARLKTAPGFGYLSAFWLASDGTWPPEIDIDETLGKEPNTAYYHTHYNANNDSHADTFTGSDLTADFHTYGVSWDVTNIRFYFDGQLKATHANTDTGDGHACKLPMFILLNIHIGNDWAGHPTSTPRGDMVVDYVRAWKGG